MQIIQGVISAITALWNKGCAGKIAVAFGALILFSICSAPFRSARPAAAPTAVAAKPTTVEVDVPTIVPSPAPTAEATPAPAATEAPVLTETPEPAPTALPASPTPDSPEARYITIAQAGVTIPSVRTADMPKGEWKADVVDNGNGPEITMTMPVGIGLSKEQLLRQAKRQIAQAVKALFDSDPKIARVSVTGTLPDGANNTELGVALIFVERATYTTWDGTPDNLGNWRVPIRYQ
jgi:hypothetical protein